MIIRSFLHIIAAALFTALAALPAASQGADKTDRLGVPGPVSFEGQNYVLAAAAHPQPNYFKQEYLPAGQGPDSYTHMFLIETMTEGAAPNDAAASQIAMLNERKAKGDPLVNHEVKFNDATGEIFLDFLISGSSNGQVVVEWDAYRYVPIKGEKPGVILYGISRRAYGETEGRAFLSGLKEQRPNTLKTLTSFDVPEITPKP
ncbi:hypothetical protein [Taklimakanibacter deserti]|uniref:hypothetical protein n=1 Tax=Taklimakanibacter deserti TaxID=2267839 RepID=UPI000E65B4A6